MLDPVNMVHLAQMRQRELLEAAERYRNATTVESPLMNAITSMIVASKRLMHVGSIAPAQTTTTPDFTEACLTC